MFIPIAIASLVLLGLVIYPLEVKQKEISTGSKKELIQKLSKGVINLLLIAGIIVVSIGYILETLFLQNFAQRISFRILNLV